MILLLACSVMISAMAQNNVNVNPQKHNNKKLSVREMDFKHSPAYKFHQQRNRISKNNHSNSTAKSGNNRSGCFAYSSSAPYTYFSASTNPIDSIVAWVWNYGDGYTDTTTNDQSSHYYYQPNYGTFFYSVCLTTIDVNGITQTCCDSVTVNSAPSCYADFSFSVDSLNYASFTDLTSTNDTIISWSWDFGDSTSSTSQSPNHQYTSTGTYYVCLTIATSSGCSNTYCYNVNVNDFTSSCNTNFSYNGVSLNYSFTDLSTTNLGNINTWYWDFGDGTTGTAQNPTHTYTQIGIYYVCLTTTTDLGCSSTWCQNINNPGGSPLIVDTIANLTQTLGNMLFGSCVSVSNLTYTGAPSAVGYFLDNGASIDSSFTYGLLLTTGSVFEAAGPNNSSSAGIDNGLPGDSDLDLLIPGYTTYDASTIEFDFTSVSDTVIASKILFASEEYPEFVGSSFNDVFGFYISGPGITGVKNLALVPNTTDPISINSVNQNLNSSYYVDNATGTTLQYDGRTAIIELRQAVIPGQSYHFKIAIADAGDGIFDSGVFIKAGSFNGNTQLPAANFTAITDTSNLTVNFNNTSVNSTVYAWDFGDGSTDITANPTHTYASPGAYNVVLLASNVCYSDTTSSTIYVGTNSVNSINTNNSIKIMPTLNEGVYNAIIQSSVNEKVEVRIFNIGGQLIYSNSYNSNVGQNKYSLDLSDYARGIYSVQIVGSKELFVSKMIR